MKNKDRRHLLATIVAVRQHGAKVTTYAGPQDRLQMEDQNLIRATGYQTFCTIKVRVVTKHPIRMAHSERRNLLCSVSLQSYRNLLHALFGMRTLCILGLTSELLVPEWELGSFNRRMREHYLNTI